MHSFFKRETKNFFSFIRRHIEVRKTGVKYIISGSMSAVVNLSILYFFTEIIGWWYLASSIMAFTLSTIVSFLFQKFWTFRDNNLKRIKIQFFIYGSLAVFNFILNPIFLYILVEAAGVWYMLGQVIVLSVLALGSYIINKSVTFKKIEEKIFEETMKNL